MVKQVNIQNWMWEKYDFTSAELFVLGCVYSFSVLKDGKLKGYKGSARQMARDLRLNHSGVSRALRKLQDMSLVIKEDGEYKGVYNIHRGVDNIHTSGDNIHTSGDNIHSPHTPLYNNSLKINNNIQAKPKATAMDSSDGLGGMAIDSFSLALFTEYYQLFPYRAKNDRIKQAAQTEFCSLSREKQQLIIDTLRQQIDNDEKLPDTSPLMYIRHFDKNAPPPDGEPVNYNNSSIPEGKFVQPAKYKGQWGMYCLADIIKYNLEVKQE